MIAQRNLSILSNRLARAGGQRIPEAVLDATTVSLGSWSACLDPHCASTWCSKEARYESTRPGSQMAEIPPFDDIFRSVRWNLRAAGLMER